MKKSQPALLKKLLSAGFISTVLVATLGSTAAMADQNGYNNHGNPYYGDTYYKNNGHYKNGYYNNHYKNDNHRYKNNSNDIEDRIKQEARYPAIKQQAIRKMNNMGYQVEDIELDEKNNRGVFEIDAKRGGQEYEVILGYPNLNIIKLEKD